MFSEEENESSLCVTKLGTGFLRRGSLNVSACRREGNRMLELKIQRPHVREACEDRNGKAERRGLNKSRHKERIFCGRNNSRGILR